LGLMASTTASLIARPNPAAAQQKRYNGKRIDLDFKNADIQFIMNVLGSVGHVRIVLDPSIKGTVTIKVQNVPWDEALDIVLRDKGLKAERENDVIHVMPAK